MDYMAAAASLIIISQHQEIAELKHSLSELAAITAVLDEEKIPTERGGKPMSIADRVRYLALQASYNADVAGEILATRDLRKDDLEAENKQLSHELSMAVMQCDDHKAAFSTVEFENKLLWPLAREVKKYQNWMTKFPTIAAKLAEIEKHYQIEQVKELK